MNATTRITTTTNASTQHVPTAARLQRASHLADIRRGASLSDVRVEVNVAHTKSRLRARFFVEMACVDSATGVITAKWGFGIDMAEIKAFETQLLRLVKKHSRGSSKRSSSGAAAVGNSHKTAALLLGHTPSQTALCTHCAMCSELRGEMKQWDKLSRLDAIGKRHMDVKCTLVIAFFRRLLRVIYTRAQWLHDCELLREILRRTESLCRIEYPNDRDALSVIASLQRIAPLPVTATKGMSILNDTRHTGKDDDCAICLSSLHATSDATGTNSYSSSPSHDGVELGCGHRFHDTCICLWFHTRLNCPICRTHAASSAAV